MFTPYISNAAEAEKMVRLQIGKPLTLEISMLITAPLSVLNIETLTLSALTG